MPESEALEAAAAWSPEGERARLEEIALWYEGRLGLSRDLGREAVARIRARARGERILELGCANGVMTRELLSLFGRMEVVESAARYARQAQQLLAGRGQVHQCLFEEFEPTGRYDTIIMACILEHVADPRALLCRARNWLTPQGEIHIVVPNADSLHRHVGVAMGLLPHVCHLNPSDTAIGHRRVYTWDTLAADIAAAGLRLVLTDGILLKPLSNSQMEGWPRQLRAAFFQISHLAPRLCAEIYAVCCASEGLDWPRPREAGLGR